MIWLSVTASRTSLKVINIAPTDSIGAKTHVQNAAGCVLDVSKSHTSASNVSMDLILMNNYLQRTAFVIEDLIWLKDAVSQHVTLTNFSIQRLKPVQFVQIQLATAKIVFIRKLNLTKLWSSAHFVALGTRLIMGSASTLLRMISMVSTLIAELK
jgi:hypothetical protein